jgi:phytoene desaturase
MRTVPDPTDSVVIIGAGLGGLSAALRLAGAGRSVTVLEREERPGGRAGRLERDGYRFELGPTVLTMPEFVADAFACVGEDLGRWLDLVPVTPAYRARFADGSHLDVHTDPDAMAEQIASVCSRADVDGYRRFVTFVRELYEVERPAFIDRNLDGVRDLVGPAAARVAALGGLRRLGPKVNSFFADERLRRIFSFQSLSAGLAPDRARAVYAAIAYMDSVAGVFYPRGGMSAVADALAGAAARHGVRFRYGTTAARIEVNGGRARAVITSDGERITADAVVVNADLPTAYHQLLPVEYTPKRVARLTYAPSCVVLHVGSSARYEELAHHTVDFGRAWGTTFREVIDQGRVMSDPSFLIANPTAAEPGLAPKDRQIYHVVFPAPNTIAGAGIDWNVTGPRYRDHIVASLEARGLKGFGDGIEVEHLVTPADWLADGLAGGTPFAADHRLSQTGPFRAPTLDRRVENLVFCGANTQPGVGVPMVLLSGRLAAERITGGRERERIRHSVKAPSVRSLALRPSASHRSWEPATRSLTP